MTNGMTPVEVTGIPTEQQADAIKLGMETQYPDWTVVKIATPPTWKVRRTPPSN